MAWRTLRSIWRLVNYCAARSHGIYVDDDEMSPEGQRRNPFFKPDLEPRTRAAPQLPHLSAFLFAIELRAIMAQDAS